MADDDGPLRGRVPDLAPETRAILAGRASNQNALAPILWATSAFTYDSVAEGRALATGVAPDG